MLKIFNFFKEHPRAKATFATKYVNPKLLNFNPDGKIRIRFSLMPARISAILEPKTSPIIQRVKALNIFIEACYEVHLNFAPIIAYEGWLIEYEKLFEDLDPYINNQYKPFIKAEYIFTYNDKQHERNIAENRLENEALI
ncbi:Putative lyase [Rickettsia akari str. Hartford]|uniref:Lyase n=1 Tax=Rickettsia akari (strain Hartford) TaxID=293614 RepID=A8GN37_RICAH|nr:spore photoproduct lyase [Rickettsia akari]ABV74812.1 Putative lyase [Rickettsia akari str. Hartford]